MVFLLISKDDMCVDPLTHAIIIINQYIVQHFFSYIRVICKVTAQTPVCILKEESEHQAHLCTKMRQKKIWTGV